MIYVLWAAVLFFAGSWTLGLLMNPRMRLKSTIVTVLYWWICIGFAATSQFSPWHLLWLMPLSLVVPMLFMMTGSVVAIFIASAIIIGPAIGALLYFGGA